MKQIGNDSQALTSRRSRANRLALLAIMSLGLSVNLLTAGSEMTATPSTLPQESSKPVTIGTKSWKPGDPLTFDNGLGAFDVEVRERVEERNNWIDFNSNVNNRDGMALLQRIRVGLRLDPAEWVSLYAQVQDSRSFLYDSDNYQPNISGGTVASRTLPPGAQRELVTNDDPFALRQANVEFRKLLDQPLSLKAGRQVLSYGDERLIGGFDWDNNARVFDAAKAEYKDAHYTIDSFASYVVPHQSNDFDVPDTHDLFTGAYLTTELVSDFQSDFYILGRDKDRVLIINTFTDSPNQTEGNQAADGDYVTAGTRWKSKPGSLNGWDLTYEGAVQGGTIVNPTGIYNPYTGAAVAAFAGIPVNTKRETLLAEMSHLEAGYTFKTDWSPRPFVSLDYGSGTDGPSGGTSHTFQNLYPTNHPLYGIMDRFCLSNMEQITVGVTAKPLDHLTLRLDWHNTWLASTSDVWRIANQTAEGEGSGLYDYSGGTRYGNALTRNPSNYVGSEINLIASYQINKWSALQIGGSHFFAGDYIRETQPTNSNSTDDADFAYTQLKFDF